MNLVIVESPAKGKTIKKFLGNDFEVMASFGHVRDLPQKTLGVDVKSNFKPEYVIPPKAKKTIKALKNEMAKVQEVYLATDYDREGEAIAWHITQACGLEKLKSQNSNLKYKRITFHEITKPAIFEAIKHPREINLHLVNAQQARRILDRLVGYKLSPFLWQKVAQGLSAGRVQSVAVRLVVEREREIRDFRPREYWQIEAYLTKDNQEFKAELAEINGQKVTKFEIKDSQEAQKILDDLKNAHYCVLDISVQEKNRYPAPPFTTSTLQQEAVRKFGFSTKKTMKIAQDLYEDGLITYMRTDSVQVSGIALAQARKVIEKDYGLKYSLLSPRFYKTKTRGAQEAHEAIRPTDLSKSVISGDNDQIRLYDLIRKRMLASQAKEAVLDETNLKIAAGKFGFSAVGVKLKFDGFFKITGRNGEEKSFGQVLPELKVNEELNLEKLGKSQHFTEPAARYTEGTLVKELEKRGIGRPSTYAPTLSTIIDRGYVKKDQGKFSPTEIAEIVTDLLVKHFPEIIDYGFTAKMEENLDEIAEGKLSWQKVTEDFYRPFAQNLAQKSKEVSKKEITEEEIDEKCPQCGKNLKIKLGRYGKFLACTGFPECKYTRPYLNGSDPEKTAILEKSSEKCPKCGKEMVLKEGKFGRFLACSGYPACKTTKNVEVLAEVSCPNCGGKLVRKNTRKGKPFWGCNSYPRCKTAFWNEPQEKPCPECGSMVTLNRQFKILKCSKCDWQGKS
jgi:DNA topoisomerase-1